MVIGRMWEMGTTLGSILSCFRDPLLYASIYGSARPKSNRLLRDTLGGRVGSPGFLAGRGVGSWEVLERRHGLRRGHALAVYAVAHFESADEFHRVESRDRDGPTAGRHVFVFGYANDAKRAQSRYGHRLAALELLANRRSDGLVNLVHVLLGELCFPRTPLRDRFVASVAGLGGLGRGLPGHEAHRSHQDGDGQPACIAHGMLPSRFRRTYPASTIGGRVPGLDDFCGREV